MIIKTFLEIFNMINPDKIAASKYVEKIIDQLIDVKWGVGTIVLTYKAGRLTLIRGGVEETFSIDRETGLIKPRD